MSALRRQVIHAAIEIQGIHSSGADKGVDLQRSIVFSAQAFQFLRLNFDVFAFLVLVTGDDLIVGNLTVKRAHLRVMNTAMTLLMKLVEVNVAATLVEGIE